MLLISNSYVVFTELIKTFHLADKRCPCDRWSKDKHDKHDSQKHSDSALPMQYIN